MDGLVAVSYTHLGSSIGISKATGRESLREAMEVAYHYDRRVLVERGIDCVEINCSAMGMGDEVEVSLCEQPVTCLLYTSSERPGVQPHLCPGA